MMCESRKRALSVVLLTCLGAFYFLSSFAFVSAQGNETPTASDSPTGAATQTYTPTVTSTFTPTVTLTFTPSATASSTTLSVEQVSTEVKSEFDALSTKLDQLSDKLEPSRANNVIDNLLASLIWSLPGFVIWITGAGAIIARFLSDLYTSRGKSVDKTLESLQKSFADSFRYALVIFVVYVTAAVLLYVGQSIVQTLNNNEIASISSKLDQIAGQLQSLSANAVQQPQTPNETDNSNLYQYFNLISLFLIVLLIISFIGNVMLMIVYGRRKQAEIVEIPSESQGTSNILDKNLAPAAFLVFILLLLPYPVDTFLLPFLLQHFLFAAFDVVRLYPNLQLKRIVVRHYSTVVFLAEFGVWTSFFNAFQDYFYPLWAIGREYLNQIVYNAVGQNSGSNWPVPTYAIVELGWSILPTALGLIIAIPGWLWLSRLVRDRSIPKIRHSLELLEGQSKKPKK